MSAGRVGGSAAVAGDVRGEWMQVCTALAPCMPVWLLAGVASFLADPRADSDALLILADALVEARTEAIAQGESFMADTLETLSRLPRVLVTVRRQQDISR